MPDRNASKSLPTLAAELKDLVVVYAKQETVGPLKNLGRFAGFGVLGAVFLSVGLLLLVLALLRAMQTEFETTFDGDLTFAPYLITVVVCTVVIGLSIRAIGAAQRRRKRS
ncbi:MAG TPA: hypothetical protein VF230_11930 [Acidimicrobiales bacterium]